MNAGYRIVGFCGAVLLGALAGCATTRPVQQVAELGEVGEGAIDADPPGKPRVSTKATAYRQCVGLATEECHKRYSDGDQALACYHARLDDCRRGPAGPSSASN